MAKDPESGQPSDRETVLLRNLHAFGDALQSLGDHLLPPLDIGHV